MGSKTVTVQTKETRTTQTAAQVRPEEDAGLGNRCDTQSENRTREKTRNIAEGKTEFTTVGKKDLRVRD